MNTKCSITPWHHSQYKTIRICDLPPSFHIQAQLKEGATLVNRKKTHSLQIIDKGVKLKKIKESERLRTIDSPQKYERERSYQKNKQKTELIKSIIVLREKKIQGRKKMSLQTDLSELDIFKPKKELISIKSTLKLPKIEIKVMK